jgi:hypothetical protein
MPRKRKEYAAPRVEKRESLTEVTQDGPTVSGTPVVKGGCFEQERAK